MHQTLLSIAISLAIVHGCSAQHFASRVEPGAAFASPASAWIESTLNRLTLEEKAAQLVFYATPASYLAENSERWRELERYAAKRKIGGFVFSIGDVYEYAMQLNRLQKLATVPLLIAGDFEYGVAMRVRHDDISAGDGNRRDA